MTVLYINRTGAPGTLEQLLLPKGEAGDWLILHDCNGGPSCMLITHHGVHLSQTRHETEQEALAAGKQHQAKYAKLDPRRPNILKQKTRK